MVNIGNDKFEYKVSESKDGVSNWYSIYFYQRILATIKTIPIKYKKYRKNALYNRAWKNYVALEFNFFFLSSRY